MKGIVLISTWALILLAAAYDGYFAWDNRDDFQTWEVNPMARVIAQRCGMGVLLGFKTAGIAFGMGLSKYCHRRRNRLTTLMTVTVGCLYLLVTVQYVIGFMSAPALERLALLGVHQ